MNNSVIDLSTYKQAKQAKQEKQALSKMNPIERFDHLVEKFHQELAKFKDQQDIK